MEITNQEVGNQIEFLRIEKAKDFVEGLDFKFGLDKAKIYTESEKAEIIAKANDASDTIFIDIGEGVNLSSEKAKQLKSTYDATHKTGDFEQLLGEYKTGLSSEFGVTAKDETEIEKGKMAAKEIFGTRDPLIKFV